MGKDMVDWGVDENMSTDYGQGKNSETAPNIWDKGLEDDDEDDDVIFLRVNVLMPIIVDLSDR